MLKEQRCSIYCVDLSSYETAISRQSDASVADAWLIGSSGRDSDSGAWKHLVEYPIHDGSPIRDVDESISAGKRPNSDDWLG
jgi:hypothetical protein